MTLKVASALNFQCDRNSNKRCSCSDLAQRRPGGSRAALPVPQVRLPAGDEQRGLACDAEVRHSGASPSWSLRCGTRVSSGLIARQIEELEESFGHGQRCSCLFFKTHQIGLLWCFCAEPQTSREVDQDWEMGLTRQSNGRLPVCVCTLFGLHFYHRTSMAGDAAAAGGAGGALRAGASLVIVDVLTGHICSVSFCLYVPTERDKYVWLVQSRRRPETWTRKGGLKRQRNPSQFLDHVLCLGNTITSRRWRASSPSRSSPTPASLVKTRSRHTS